MAETALMIKAQRSMSLLTHGEERTMQAGNIMQKPFMSMIEQK